MSQHERSGAVTAHHRGPRRGGAGQPICELRALAAHEAKESQGGKAAQSIAFRLQPRPRKGEYKFTTFSKIQILPLKKNKKNMKLNFCKQ